MALRARLGQERERRFVLRLGAAGQRAMWGLLIAVEIGCSVGFACPKTPPTAPAVVVRAFAQALKDRDARAYAEALSPTKFQSCGKLISSDEVAYCFDLQEERQAIEQVFSEGEFRDGKGGEPEVRIVDGKGPDFLLSIRATYSAYFDKNGASLGIDVRIRSRLRIHVDRADPSGARIVEIAEDLADSGKESPTPSLGLIKYLHSNLFELKTTNRTRRRPDGAEVRSQINEVIDRRTQQLKLIVRDVGVDEPEPNYPGGVAPREEKEMLDRNGKVVRGVE